MVTYIIHGLLVEVPSHYLMQKTHIEFIKSRHMLPELLCFFAEGTVLVFDFTTEGM